MAREFRERPLEELEIILEESLDILGIDTLDTNQVKLLLRLFLSGVARYYFYHPDDVINIGFLRFEKSPAKEELFKVLLTKNIKEGVINADTLWKYYKGDLRRKEQFKETLETFMKDLINYSQEQEINITKLTSGIDVTNKKGEINYGIQKNQW